MCIAPCAYREKNKIMCAKTRQQQPRRRQRARVHAVCVVHNNNIKTIIITIIVRAFTLFEMFTRCVISAMLQFLRNKKAFVLYKVSVRVCACVQMHISSISVCVFVCQYVYRSVINHTQ